MLSSLVAAYPQFLHYTTHQVTVSLIDHIEAKRSGSMVVITPLRKAFDWYVVFRNTLRPQYEPYVSHELCCRVAPLANYSSAEMINQLFDYSIIRFINTV